MKTEESETHAGREGCVGPRHEEVEVDSSTQEIALLYRSVRRPLVLGTSKPGDIYIRTNQQLNYRVFSCASHGETARRVSARYIHAREAPERT